MTMQTIGRRIRLGMIGGGPGSVIGETHRIAARLDGMFDIVASALSSDPQRSRQAGIDLGIASDRAHGSWREMLEAEVLRADRADAVAIMTPNDSHHEICIAALEAGFHVICDKPLTHDLASARQVAAKVTEVNRAFCVTYCYVGYPMVRQARDMVLAGELGEIRQVHLHYVQSALAARDLPTGWRMDPARSGGSLVLMDIGTHAYHLGAFVTGLEARSLCADVGSAMPGRTVDDYAAALLRYENGARGSMWVTNAAAGSEHGLSFRIHGDRGGLEWHQEEPNRLLHRRQDGFEQILTRRLGPAMSPGARMSNPHRHRPSRGIPRGLRQPVLGVRARRRAAHRGPGCAGGSASLSRGRGRRQGSGLRRSREQERAVRTLGSDRVGRIGAAVVALEALARSDESLARSDERGDGGGPRLYRVSPLSLAAGNGGRSMSKVWLITGSSRGLGAAIAKAAAEAGHRVAATARRTEQLAPLVEAYPDRVRAIALDVTDAAAARAAVEETVGAFGRLDVVVNNAGYADIASIEDGSDEALRAQFETNFFGLVNVTRAALPILRRQRAGRFIQFSSIGGRKGTPGLSAYQSAKFAVEGFSEVLALETRPLGIRVTIVEPGGFRTDFAGPSMRVHPVQADYEPTVGAFVRHFAEHAENASGNPARGAQAILQVADAPDPPLRLLLGTDAIFLARKIAAERAAEDEKWRSLSASTDFEGLPDFADTPIAKMLLAVQS